MARFLVMLALAVQVLGSAGLCAVADGACRGACGVSAAVGDCGPLSACGGRSGRDVSCAPCEVTARPMAACRGDAQRLTLSASVAAPIAPFEPCGPPCDRCEPCPLDEPFQAPLGSGHELAAAALLSEPVQASPMGPGRSHGTSGLGAKGVLNQGRLRPSICVWVI